MEYDVTIGIPLYEAELYIKRSLESALSQSYPSIEYLIIDDCGHDNSMTVVREIQKTHSRGKDIRILSHSSNMGVSASRNQIIDEARGRYLYFMDSDDVISNDAISLLMDAVGVNDAEIAFGSYEKIETSGKCTLYQYPSLQLTGKDQLASFAYRRYGGIQASACNYLVKVSLLRDSHLRFIDADYWEDFVFTFDLVTFVSRAVLLPDITYSYYCREHSLSNYQGRAFIPKSEILRNAQTIQHLKETSPILYNKVYYPNRCYNIVMTDFYIACHIVKRRKQIVPSVTNREMKHIMSHPATFRQILFSRQSRLKNLSLYLLSKLPSSLCVGMIWCIGKMKKLV